MKRYGKNGLRDLQKTQIRNTLSIVCYMASRSLQTRKGKLYLGAMSTLRWFFVMVGWNYKVQEFYRKLKHVNRQINWLYVRF